MVAAAEEFDDPILEQYSFVGELALSGAVRSVRGVLPAAIEASEDFLLHAARVTPATPEDALKLISPRPLR